MGKWIRRILLVAVAAGVVAALYVAMQPKPVLVDTAVIEHGPLVVTISDDGRTRIRERYVVSAPLSGRLVRIALHPGDEVVAKKTLLTTIEPTDPSLLDPRAVALAAARVKAAEARVHLARPRLNSAKATMDMEETELGRQAELARRQASTKQSLEQQQVAYRKAEADFNAASFETEIARFELEQAKAALLRTTEDEQPTGNEWSFPIKSPITGRVLRVFQESSIVVNAGAQILEVGDSNDLEVVVDVLSTDAIQVRPGARVLLKEWGGDKPLNAHVRLVEPSAFTKVSALGIEEQRVNVIIDFKDTPSDRPTLGDGFRVEADIVHWEAESVLTVPSGALFRDSGKWAVFVISDNQAVLRHIELGHRNDDNAEVISGLKPDERVILYPGDRVEIGNLVQERDGGRE